MNSAKMQENNVIGIAEGWNAGFVEGEERAMVVRDYLWASELGNAPIDIFLRLKAMPPSNPPNDRAKRKMGAGVDWEFTIEQILASAGILAESQVYCKYQYAGLMQVTGRLDFMIGGKCDLEKAEKYLAEGVKYISPNRVRAARNALRYYQAKYPEGFGHHPIELKSISDYAMDDMEKSNKPILRHQLQLFHYMKALGHDKATLSYLNRNDERMMEFTITATPELEAQYMTAIKTISGYVMSDTIPPIEKLIIFNEQAGKFSKNLNVEYSNYLTKLYKFIEPREYSEIYGKKAIQWNSALSRVKLGKKMTAKNEEWLTDIRAAGYNVEELITKLTPEPSGDEDNGA